ncbi:MAG: AAA family ATPase, partial [Desulfosarcina sp.]|nr:AAA family ATPase [Desulfobacterales bacterium]
MYRAYYGLDKKPFQISADPEFLWLGPKHKEGLAILIYGVRDNKGFLVLSGGVGTGKTTLIHALLKQLDDSVIVASVPDPGLKLIEFYNYIASAFGMQGAYTSKVDFLLDFEAFLRQMHARGRTVLLIIDEAQRLNPTMLEEIRLLSNIETPEQKLLNIFFVGQEEFFDILSDPLNRALRQRITINYHLNTLSMDETRTLIEYRLKVAGATRPIFSEDAIQGVYSFSQGAPRRINIICDHALLTGYVENNPTIGVDIIRDCFDELMLPGEKCPPCEALGPIRLKPLSTAPTPSAAAIVKTTVLKAPPSPLKSKRERALIFTATLLVVVITAYFYFKPQHAIAPPPGEIIAEARRAETSIDATVETADDTPDTTTAAPSDQAAPLEPPETAVTASVSDHGNFDSLSAPPAVTPFPTVTGADETSDVAALQADSAEPVPADLLADLDSPVTEAIDPIATESAPVAGVSSDPVHMSPPQEKP